MHRVYTVGHSNHSIEDFIGMLQRVGIRTIADIRSKPFSRYNPQFDRYALAESLRFQGIPYMWNGHSLGGLPEDPALLGPGNRPDYDKMRVSEGYKRALEDLINGITHPLLAPICLMCSEEDPSKCHRRRLVGVDLVARGFLLTHIRKNARLQTEHDVREKLGENQPSILDLFKS